jgi:hypothetical protein
MADDTVPERPGGDDDSVEDLPTVSCSRCGRDWDLGYELDELRAGNRAVEQFALDHERHTGHFPDDVTPWLVDCRRCPEREGYLAQGPAHRWATTHARHTGHAVEVRPPTGADDTEVVGRDAG